MLTCHAPAVLPVPAASQLPKLQHIRVSTPSNLVPVNGCSWEPVCLPANVVGGRCIHTLDATMPPAMILDALAKLGCSGMYGPICKHRGSPSLCAPIRNLVDQDGAINTMQTAIAGQRGTSSNRNSVGHPCSIRVPVLANGPAQRRR